MRYKPITLVADDSHVFAMYFTILLGRMGFDVIPVSTGEDAFKLSKVFNPDLITLETMLPKTDGVAALKNIKGDEEISNIPVIMISKDSAAKTQKACLKAGASGYLTKPLDIMALHKAIQDCLVYSKGHKREHLRTTCNERVILQHNGITKHVTAITLSEGGMYVKEKNLLPVSTKLKIIMSLSGKEKIALAGSIIYTKGIYREGLIKTIPGMAIRFNKTPKKHAPALRAKILSYLLEDIINETGNDVITVGKLHRAS